MKFKDLINEGKDWFSIAVQDIDNDTAVKIISSLSVYDFKQFGKLQYNEYLGARGYHNIYIKGPSGMGKKRAAKIFGILSGKYEVAILNKDKVYGEKVEQKTSGFTVEV